MLARVCLTSTVVRVFIRVLRVRERKTEVKYTHPSTAAVAHVTVATDSNQSELPGSAQCCRLPPLPAATRGFSSSIEYGGDGSPLPSSLRNSSLSSPSTSPRVTFEEDVPRRGNETRGSPDDGERARSPRSGGPGPVALDVESRRPESGAVADHGPSNQPASTPQPDHVDVAPPPSTSHDEKAAKTGKRVSIVEPPKDEEVHQTSTQPKAARRKSTAEGETLTKGSDSATQGRIIQ